MQKRVEELEQELKVLLLPKDPNDDKNVIVEFRAGAGGDEAALFTAEICRMYIKYAESRGWKTELTSADENGIGGFKDATLRSTEQARTPDEVRERHAPRTACRKPSPAEESIPQP